MTEWTRGLEGLVCERYPWERVYLAGCHQTSSMSVRMRMIETMTSEVQHMTERPPRSKAHVSADRGEQVRRELGRSWGAEVVQWPRAAFMNYSVDDSIRLALGQNRQIHFRAPHIALAPEDESCVHRTLWRFGFRCESHCPFSESCFSSCGCLRER